MQLMHASHAKTRTQEGREAFLQNEIEKACDAGLSHFSATLNPKEIECFKHYGYTVDIIGGTISHGILECQISW